MDCTAMKMNKLLRHTIMNESHKCYVEHRKADAEGDMECVTD